MLIPCRDAPLRIDPRHSSEPGFQHGYANVIIVEHARREVLLPLGMSDSVTHRHINEASTMYRSLQSYLDLAD